MADGSTKKIKDVKVGDKVLATDPATGRTAARTVTALHVNQDTDLTDVTIRTPNGSTAALRTTQHHRFWDATTRTWVDAAHLQPGHALRAASGPTLATVVAVYSYPGSHQMRDLTVATDHTYYVVAGTTPVLVHNCGDGIPETPTGSRGNPLRTNTPNSPDTINGRDYSGHSLGRMQQQGIMPSVVENTVRGPGGPGKVPGTTAYYDSVNDITVITDTATGRVVTVDYGMIRQ